MRARKEEEEEEGEKEEEQHGQVLLFKALGWGRGHVLCRCLREAQPD